MDEINSEPRASRQSIKMVVYPDGQSEYLIEEQEPQRHDFPSDFEGVPVDDTPPVVKTKVIGGTAYFYDAQDVLLYEHPVGNDMLLPDQIAQLSGQYDWLAHAKIDGGEIVELEPGTILIRKLVADQVPLQDPKMRVAGQYTEEVIVPDLNLLLGASLHEADGTLKSRMIYRYQYLEDNEQWIPEMMLYEEYGVDGTTGSKFISKTNYYIENYYLQLN